MDGAFNEIKDWLELRTYLQSYSKISIFGTTEKKNRKRNMTHSNVIKSVF